MAKILTQEQKDGLAKSFPHGDRWQKRKVVSVSIKNAWYKVGDIITVKHFSTFGAYDENDCWINYYDLSPEIKREISEKEKDNLIQLELDRILEACRYLNEWDDMPMSYLSERVCKILLIKHNQAGYNMALSLLIRPRRENAVILYNCRGHEYIEEVKKKTFLQKIFS